MPSSSLEYYLDRLVDFIQEPRFEADLRRSKKEYFGTPVPRFTSEAEYELNVSNFLDWYIFDRPIRYTEYTPLQLFVKENKSRFSDEEAAVYADLLNSRYSLFRLRKKTGSGYYLEDLLSGTIYFIKNLKILPKFSPGNYIATRVLKFGEEYRLASTIDLIPEKIGEFVVDYFILLREEGKEQPLTSLFIRSIRLELAASNKESTP